MRKAVNLSAALTAVAAMVGAGFASGRELVVFFSGQGAPSWLGVAVACVGAGFLTGAIAAMARRTGRRELPGVFQQTMGRGAGLAMQVVYAAMLILCAAAMLSTGATLGALTFPFHGSFLLGTLIVLAAGLLLTLKGALPVAGMVIVGSMAAWYLALGAGQDVSDIRVGGSVGISAASGMIYAAFNATVAAGVVCLSAEEDVKPVRVGLYTGLLLAAMLIPANWALLRAGSEVRQMALPTVVMAHRWGIAGYYLSVLALFLAVVTTLSAALKALRAQLTALGLRPSQAVFFSSAAALMLSMAGLTALVGVGYPALGLVCAVMLLILLSYL
jgi:uncharacterized membrane protein YkvI